MTRTKEIGWASPWLEPWGHRATTRQFFRGGIVRRHEQDHDNHKLTHPLYIYYMVQPAPEYEADEI
jgi:hypothetical protein